MFVDRTTALLTIQAKASLSTNGERLLINVFWGDSYKNSFPPDNIKILTEIKLLTRGESEGNWRNFHNKNKSNYSELPFKCAVGIGDEKMAHAKLIYDSLKNQVLRMNKSFPINFSTAIILGNYQCGIFSFRDVSINGNSYQYYI